MAIFNPSYSRKSETAAEKSNKSSQWRKRNPKELLFSLQRHSSEKVIWLLSSGTSWTSKNKVSDIIIGIHVDDALRVQKQREKDLTGDKFMFEITLLIFRSVSSFNNACRGKVKPER